MNQTIKEFADDLAAVEFDGVYTTYSDIPKDITKDTFPVSWVDMPTALISPEQSFSVFSESGSQHTLAVYIAVSLFVEGFPAEQRTAVLEMADTVEQWAKGTPYTVRLFTGQKITVGSKEYRGVVAQVTSNDDI